MNRKITFKIQKGGNVQIVDASGFGTGCQQATQDIERLLGKVDEKSREVTENYFQKVDDVVLKVNA